MIRPETSPFPATLAQYLKQDFFDKNRLPTKKSPSKDKVQVAEGPRSPEQDLIVFVPVRVTR
jgi:hypothetical protein